MKECPCFSNESYETCCQPYHKGKIPKDVQNLMRSRFSAYVLGLAEYIIQTTHSDSTTYQEDKKKWIEDILQFHRDGKLKSLEILDSKQHEEVAFVVFIITIEFKGKINVYTEKSCFLKVQEKWLFRDSLIKDGKCTVEQMNNL